MNTKTETAKEVYNENTIAGVAMNRIGRFRDKVYMQSRFDKSGRKTEDIHSVTWGDLDELVRWLTQGMDALGLQPHDRIAVLGPNTPRWVMAIYGIIFFRGTFVPLYATSKKEDVWWCLYDSSAKAIFCHDEEHLAKVMEVRDRLPNLEWIIAMYPEIKKDDPGVLTFNDLLARGRENHASEEKIQQRIREAEEEDVVSIIYTSGTTGKPKGVMLSNRNFVSQRSITNEYGFRPDDIWLGHLPMCHVLGLSSDLLNSGFQGGTLFVADSVETEEMRANLAACRPTIMTSVPRLWEKLYLQINTLVRERPQVVQNLFNWSVTVGKDKFTRTMEDEAVPVSLQMKSKLAGRIFRRVRKEAGLDRLRICITGGGPIHPDLLTFFGAMGIKIYQGFGLTETSPVTHACTPANNKLGWVGKPIPNTECRIEEDGELLIKGPQVMCGYYNNPEATKDAFTEDGFLKTGDIAEVDEDGFVRITDRKKDLLITSGGKNIAPQPIQNAFNTDPYIEQICVIGDARKYIAALIVPNFDFLEKWAKDKGIKYKGRDELINNEKVQKLFNKRVEKVNATLGSTESIKRFAILTDEFTVEGGELTPTLKMKRKAIEEKYKDTIDSLYPKEVV